MLVTMWTSIREIFRFIATLVFLAYNVVNLKREEGVYFSNQTILTAKTGTLCHQSAQKTRYFCTHAANSLCARALVKLINKSNAR